MTLIEIYRQGFKDELENNAFTEFYTIEEVRAYAIGRMFTLIKGYENVDNVTDEEITEILEEYAKCN